jgi:restriction endonuclease S subunit
MTWKAYPEYKDSGIEWLDKIPHHWEIWKVTHDFNKVGSGTTPKSDDLSYYHGDVPWVTTTELRETLIGDTNTKLTPKALQDYSALRLYPEGTLLIAMYGATIGRLGILSIPATVNQACCAFSEPTRSDIKFFYYWLMYRRPILISLSVGGGQPNLRQEDLRSLRVPLPSLAEQRSIAAFLDRETKRIDSLIAKKERQIELLQEKRAALISHVVTKGLNPNVKMKDSGIEWLGEIPEHWEAKALRHLIIGGTRNGLYKNREHYQDDGIPMIQMGEAFEFPVIEKCAYDRVRLMPSELILWQLVEGDLLFARRSLVFEGSGKCSIVGKLPEPHVFESSLIRVCPNKSLVIPFFLYWFLQSKFSRSEILAMTKKVTISGIDSQQIKGMTVVVPPLHEQKEIVKLIGRKNSEIDSLMGKLLESIERIKEYRNTLISAAVTGKIDVRKEVV